MYSRQISLVLASLLLLTVVLLASISQECSALRVEIASRIVCGPSDYRNKIDKRKCRPLLRLPLKACNQLMRNCKCQHDIPMKWTYRGCPKESGDGGCQCLDYCGWKCRDKCLADPENRCEWISDQCRNKFTGETGPLTNCQDSVGLRRPTKSPVTPGPTLLLNPIPLAPINLGTAENFVILTKSGVSNVPSSRIVGDIGVSPISSTAITGFNLNLVAPAKRFATSIYCVGRIYAANYASPTPSMLTVAIGDMETAYTAAAGLPADFTELATGNIGGLTLVTGVYRWGTDVNIASDVTIFGASNDVWVFQVAGNVLVASAAMVVLQGGAQASNIFWQVAGEVNIGTNAHFEGVILSKTAVKLLTGATMNGRALAQTAVTLDQNEVIAP